MSVKGGSSSDSNSNSANKREYVALQNADTDYQSQFRREAIIARKEAAIAKARVANEKKARKSGDGFKSGSGGEPDDVAALEQELAAFLEDNNGDLLATVLSGVSREGALGVGGFSLLMPILVQTLKLARADSREACVHSLEVLSEQLQLNKETLILEEASRKLLLEGVFECIYRNVVLGKQAVDCLSAICEVVVSTEQDVAFLANMYLQCGEKARKQVVLPALFKLTQNEKLEHLGEKQRWKIFRRQLHHVLLVAQQEQKTDAQDLMMALSYADEEEEEEDDEDWTIF